MAKPIQHFRSSIRRIEQGWVARRIFFLRILGRRHILAVHLARHGLGITRAEALLELSGQQRVATESGDERFLTVREGG